MKLFMLSDPESIHTKRWISSLSERGIEIFLFGIGKKDDEFYGKCKNTSVYTLDYKTKFRSSSVEKIIYLLALNNLKKKIRDFQPDILHAHYASSYGLLGVLTRFHPLIISVWGSDVYSFPKISILHRAILKYNLSKADQLLSTSNIMVGEISKYTSAPIQITPFGVDLNLFKKMDSIIQQDKFIVGTVKALSVIYRIDIILKSFKKVIDNNPKIKLKLKIIGDGPEKEELKSLTISLGIEKNVDFLGRIENKLLPDFYNSFSVFVSVSDSESFGVVAIEAMACECPVIVSDADGFIEVVKNEETGIIVPRGDVDATAHAIQRLINDRSLGEKMGLQGRERVERLYDWNENVDKMLKIYQTLLSH